MCEKWAEAYFHTETSRKFYGHSNNNKRNLKIDVHQTALLAIYKVFAPGGKICRAVTGHITGIVRKNSTEAITSVELDEIVKYFSINRSANSFEICNRLGA